MRSFSFTVKEKDYWIKYDFNAICDIEEVAGKPVQAIYNEQSMGFNAIRMLIWGGLKHADRGLTIQRTGIIIKDFLDEGGKIGDLTEKASQCLLYALHVETEESDGEGE